ncbi:MAG: hydrogen gas-evolving membrane-bound hydrogenase subunit E, partial [bacterium]
WVALRDMPPFGGPLMRVSTHYVRYALSEVKAANVVAAVILDYRGYDTLGEAIVLFTSILGAFVVLRRRGKKAEYEDDTEHVGIME